MNFAHILNGWRASALLVAFLAMAAFGGSQAIPAEAAVGLNITKDALGLHSGGPNDGEREYRLRANLTAQSDPLAPSDVVHIIDDVDDDLVILAIHNVHAGWSCNVVNAGVHGTGVAGQHIRCNLSTNSQLTGPNPQIIVLYDACDTLTRGSVDNTATIYLNGTAMDSDQANPNVFDCDAPEVATLVIEKACLPEAQANANVTFTFDISASGNHSGEASNLPLDCGDESSVIDLDVGTEYDVVEDLPPTNWAFTSAVCTDVTEQAITRGARFTPADGDTIVCTFTNTFTAPTNPTLVITKVCLPAEFANAAATFGFNVEGTGTAAGDDSDPDVDCGGSSAVINLAAGVAYSVVEDSLESGDWAFTSADCTGVTDGAVANGRSFTPDADDVITCTFTNTFTPPSNPTLIIAKVCLPAEFASADATFGFDVDGTDTAAGDDSDPDVDCGDSSAVINLAGGVAYTVVEDSLPAGNWALTSADCTGVTDAAVTNGRSFTPDANDIITCTFTNTFTPPNDPTLVIQKVCLPADFANATALFGFDVDGEGTAAGDTTDPDVNCGDSSDLITLDAGVAYTVLEDSLASGDWAFTSANCTGVDEGTVTNGVSFTPAVENVIVCTFTNTFTPPSNPTLLIQKLCGPAGFEDANATFGFDVEGTGTAAGDNGDPSIDCGEASAVINLAAGVAYTVVENSLQSADWSLTAADCAGVPDAAVANGRSFTPDADDVVVCTFTNTVALLGSITIEKEVPGTDPENFSFTDNIPGCSIGELDDHSSIGTPQSVTCPNLPSGTYTISEDGESGWDLVDIDCSGDDVSAIDIDNDPVFEGANGFNNGDDTVIIQLAAGENITCIFFNEEEVVVEETPPEDNTPPAGVSTPVAQVQGVTATATPRPATSQPAPVAQVESVRALPNAGSGGYLTKDRQDLSSVFLLFGAGGLGLVIAFSILRWRRRT